MANAVTSNTAPIPSNAHEIDEKLASANRNFQRAMSNLQEALELAKESEPGSYSVAPGTQALIGTATVAKLGVVTLRDRLGVVPAYRQRVKA